MNYFIWNNKDVDVVSPLFLADRLAEQYLEKVVRPSIENLNTAILDQERSDDPISCFIQSDLEFLRTESLINYAAAIQALWERQFRNYVSETVKKIKPEVSQLPFKLSECEEELFKARGIHFKDFPQSPQLYTLNYLGNAAKHGDGQSLNNLICERPNLWKHLDGIPFPEDLPTKKTIQNIRLTFDDLKELSYAIRDFWQTIDFIRCCAFSRKSANVRREIDADKQEFRWLKNYTPNKETRTPPPMPSSPVSG